MRRGCYLAGLISISMIVSLIFSNIVISNKHNVGGQFEFDDLAISDEIKDDEKIYSAPDHKPEQSIYEKNIDRFGTGNFFTSNYGQVGSDDVSFYIQGQGVWFTSSGMVIELNEPLKAQKPTFNEFIDPLNLQKDLEKKNEMQKNAVVIFEYVNCNYVRPIGIAELSHRSNFFYGNDSGKWCTDVPNYREIYYENIYDKIDLRYYFNGNGLKYDLTVHPGGDPNDIMIKVNGAEELSIGSSTLRSYDTLNIKTELADITDSNLFVYQENNGMILEVSAGFKLVDPDRYGFTIDEYDHRNSLVIDPLIFSTYLGGLGQDSVKAMAVDENDDIYLTGWTYSSNFPLAGGINNNTHHGNGDIYVTKMDSNGSSLIYSTYIGGAGDDIPNMLVLNSNGSAFLTGYTGSDNFPTTTGAYDTTYNGWNELYHDVIVCKLNPFGNKLNFSTLIGTLWIDIGIDMVLDDQENIYITGVASMDYPQTPGVYNSTSLSQYNVFITKLNATGTGLIHSTVIGSGDGNDFGHRISLDEENNVYITGFAGSTSFPTTSGAFRESFSHIGGEGFVFKLNSNLSSLLCSTFIGTLSSQWWGFQYTNIVLDSADNLIVCGNVWPDDELITPDAFDPTHNGNSDMIIMKLNSDLSTLLYGTYLGGKGNDVAYDLEIDYEDNIFITGSTNSTDFPVLEGVYDQGYNGNTDVFVIKFNITDSLLKYSTFIGGKNNETGLCVVQDKNGSIYVGGRAEPGFPTTPGSYSPSHNGGLVDGFFLLLAPLSRAIILDLNISERIVYRPHTIELYSNASDNEDLEKFLTPHFEYMSPGQSDIWSTIHLDKPVFKNDRWQSTFTIPVNASLGFYDFRVRYNDTDLIWSRWQFLNDSLLVLNNPPKIDHFNISKHEAIIDEKIKLLVLGKDVEDGPTDLKPEVEYKYNSEIFWDPLEYDELDYLMGRWECTFSMNSAMEYGYYDFRVRVNDTDSDYSGWSYMNSSLLFRSGTPEILSISLSRPEIYRTEQVEISINCSDPDTLLEDIIMELQYLSVMEGNWFNASAEYYGELWETALNSKETWALGIYNFRARAFDWEENTSPWFYLNDSLNVLNNKPRMLEIGSIPEQMDRGRSISIAVDSKDKENDEDELVIELEYKLPGSNNWISEYLSSPDHSDDNWHSELTLPRDAPTGAYSFRARVQDMDNDWSTYLYMNDSMRVTNHAPVVISFEQTPAEVYRTETVMITADGSDIETLKDGLECMIYYLAPGSYDWQKLDVNNNATTNSFFSVLITTKSFKLGNYSFKVEFKDADGVLSIPVYANRTVWVRNNLPVISDELDDIQVGSTQVIIKLEEYGYDLETSKNNLRWKLDFATVNSKLFYINEVSLNNRELVIYPIRSKQGQDDITLILIDRDNGRVTKTDITIVIDSRSERDAAPPDEDDPMKKIVGSMIWLYILVIIIILILFVLFIMYRRKKKQKEEEMQREKEEAEKVLEASREEALPAAAETVQLPPVEPAAEPAATLEPSPEPAPVPMPEVAQKAMLPATTATAEPQLDTAGNANPKDETSVEQDQKAADNNDENNSES